MLCLIFQALSPWVFLFIQFCVSRIDYVHTLSRFIFVQFVSLFCNSIPDVIVSAQRDFVLKREHVLQKGGTRDIRCYLEWKLENVKATLASHIHMGNWHHDCWKSRCPSYADYPSQKVLHYAKSRSVNPNGPFPEQLDTFR